jgi:ABC-type transport system substrate-binding protein
MQLTDDPNDALRTDLAERYRVYDGVKYEFVLKRDLKFSDGSPVTALDFKWSWERALKPSTGSEHAAEVLGLISGASEVIAGETEDLAGVEAVDDRTLLVTLSEPSAIFPYLLASPVAAVLKRENVENWGLDWAERFRPRAASDRWTATAFEELPVGTGPFKVAVFDFERDKYVLVRNDHYHEGPPMLDGVEFVTDLFEERDGRMVASFDRMFQEGQIDWTFGDLSDVKNELGGDIVTNVSGKRSAFLLFNSGLPPYDDLHFRRALIGSVDLESHHDEDERHEIPGSLIPPLLTGHDPDLSGVGYDLAEAIDNVERSAYAGDVSELRPTYHTDVDGMFKEEFEFLSRAWQDSIGMDEGRYLYSHSARYKELLETGRLEMVFIDVDARYPDGLAVLSELFQAFGVGNSSAGQAELDGMIRSAKADSDAVSRLERYSDIQKFALDEALVMPFEWPSSAGFAISLQSWVRGYHEPTFHGSRLKDIWFDETAPKRELPLS